MPMVSVTSEVIEVIAPLPWRRSFPAMFAKSVIGHIEDAIKEMTWLQVCSVFIMTSLLIKIPYFWTYIRKNESKFKRPETRYQALIYLMQILVATVGVSCIAGTSMARSEFLPVNETVAWIGVWLGVANLVAIEFIHAALGSRGWSPTVVAQKDQKLVVRGPYRFARHPMYLMYLLHPLVVLLISQNLLLTSMVTAGILYAMSGIKHEERLLIEEFGQDYTNYIRAVPALGPVDRIVGTCGLTSLEAVAILEAMDEAAEKAGASNGKGDLQPEGEREKEE